MSETLHYQTLKDICPTMEDPTLEALSNTLKVWADQAQLDGKIDMLRTVAEAFAIEGDRYPYSGHTPFLRYRVKTLCLHYKERPNLLIGGRYIYGKFYTLIVTQDGKAPFELIEGFRLVNWTGGIPDNAMDEGDFHKYLKTPTAGTPFAHGRNLYLPGEWEKTFLGSCYTLAMTALEMIQTDDERSQRDRILAEIGITPPTYDKE